MKKILLALFTLLFSLTAFAALGGKISEPEGGFSIQVPSGWEIKNHPQLKYKLAIGPAANGFATNLNVVDEVFAGDVNAYAQYSLANLQLAFPQFKLVKRAVFPTASGLQGVKLVTTSAQNNLPLRQVFYLFQGNDGRFFVLTCSTLAASGDLHDGAFDESAKTFMLQ